MANTYNVLDMDSFVKEFMKDRIKETNPDIDLSDNSTFNDLFISPLVPIIRRLVDMVSGFEYKTNLKYASLLSEVELNELGENNYFIARNTGSRATGVVIFKFNRMTKDDTVRIPSGLVVYSSEDNLKYAITNSYTISYDEMQNYYDSASMIYKVPMLVSAASEGSAYNKAAGAIDSCSEMFSPFLIGVTNESEISGGFDAESNEDYVARMRNFYVSQHLGTRPGYMADIANNFPGVNSVSVVGKNDELMTRDKIYQITDEAVESESNDGFVLNSDVATYDASTGKITVKPEFMRHIGFGGKVDIYIKGALTQSYTTSTSSDTPIYVLGIDYSDIDFTKDEKSNWRFSLVVSETNEPLTYYTPREFSLLMNIPLFSTTNLIPSMSVINNGAEEPDIEKDTPNTLCLRVDNNITNEGLSTHKAEANPKISLTTSNAIVVLTAKMQISNSTSGGKTGVDFWVKGNDNDRTYTQVQTPEGDISQYFEIIEYALSASEIDVENFRSNEYYEKTTHDSLVTYSRTQDTNYDSSTSKTYYNLTCTPATPASYTPTSDTAVISSKTYYTYDDTTKTYVVVSNPQTSDINSYFEKVEKTYYKLTETEFVRIRMGYDGANTLCQVIDTVNTAINHNFVCYGKMEYIQLNINFNTNEFIFATSKDGITFNEGCIYTESGASHVEPAAFPIKRNVNANQDILPVGITAIGVGLHCDSWSSDTDVPYTTNIKYINALQCADEKQFREYSVSSSDDSITMQYTTSLFLDTIEQYTGKYILGAYDEDIKIVSEDDELALKFNLGQNWDSNYASVVKSTTSSGKVYYEHWYDVYNANQEHRNAYLYLNDENGFIKDDEGTAVSIESTKNGKLQLDFAVKVSIGYDMYCVDGDFMQLSISLRNRTSARVGATSDDTGAEIVGQNIKVYRYTSNADNSLHLPDMQNPNRVYPKDIEETYTQMLEQRADSLGLDLSLYPTSAQKRYALQGYYATLKQYWELLINANSFQLKEFADYIQADISTCNTNSSRKQVIKTRLQELASATLVMLAPDRGTPLLKEEIAEDKRKLVQYAQDMGASKELAETINEGHHYEDYMNIAKDLIPIVLQPITKMTATSTTNPYQLSGAACKTVISGTNQNEEFDLSVNNWIYIRTIIDFRNRKYQTYKSLDGTNYTTLCPAVAFRNTSSKKCLSLMFDFKWYFDNALANPNAVRRSSLQNYILIKGMNLSYTQDDSDTIDLRKKVYNIPDKTLSSEDSDVFTLPIEHPTISNGYTIITSKDGSEALLIVKDDKFNSEYKFKYTYQDDLSSYKDVEVNVRGVTPLSVYDSDNLRYAKTIPLNSPAQEIYKISYQDISAGELDGAKYSNYSIIHRDIYGNIIESDNILYGSSQEKSYADIYLNNVYKLEYDDENDRFYTTHPYRSDTDLKLYYTANSILNDIAYRYNTSNDRIITTDVLVKNAQLTYLNMWLEVKPMSGIELNSVRKSEIISEIQKYINTLPIGGNVQMSDIVNYLYSNETVGTYIDYIKLAFRSFYMTDENPASIIDSKNNTAGNNTLTAAKNTYFTLGQCMITEIE